MTERAFDSHLIQRIQQGDIQALGALYDRYSTPAYSLALRILRCPNDAADVLEETWVEVWNSALPIGNGGVSVAAWVLERTRGRAIDRLLGRSRTGPAVVPLTGCPLRDASEAQLHAWARAALDTLDESQRQALELSYFSGLSQYEIAVHLGVPSTTVLSWMRHGLMRLSEAGNGGEAQGHDPECITAIEA